jgi:hypothetical protein
MWWVGVRVQGLGFVAWVVGFKAKSSEGSGGGL